MTSHLNTCITPGKKCGYHVTSHVKIRKIPTDLYCCKKWREEAGKVIRACEPEYIGKELTKLLTDVAPIGRTLTWLDGYST